MERTDTLGYGEGDRHRVATRPLLAKSFPSYCLRESKAHSEGGACHSTSCHPHCHSRPPASRTPAPTGLSLRLWHGCAHRPVELPQVPVLCVIHRVKRTPGSTSQKTNYSFDSILGEKSEKETSHLVKRPIMSLAFSRIFVQEGAFENGSRKNPMTRCLCRFIWRTLNSTLNPQSTGPNAVVFFPSSP